MADTTFVNGSTLSDDAWFNDINDLFYTAMGGVAGAGTITKVQFPATQVASGDANALDDYEEGTWTPTLSFATPGDLSVSYGTRVGHYTKIGNRVFISCDIATSAFTHTTASGALQITGTPFSSANVAGLETRGKVSWQGITKANYTEIAARLPENNTGWVFPASGSGQSLSNVDAADMPTGGSVVIRFNASFRV